ncbi:hypothetical protein EON65_08885 [archaeon]|nr:MAG: hypothetical protein EON65_08885 [archaeon]
MSCIRKGLLDKIIVLSKQGKREDAVACVILFDKWRAMAMCSACESLSDEKILTKLAKKVVQPALIAQMVSIKSNPSIRSAAVSFLLKVFASQSEMAFEWTADLEDSLLSAIIECALIGPEDRSRYEAQLVLRSLPERTRRYSPLQIVEALVSHPAVPTLSNPSEILSLVNDISNLPFTLHFDLSDQLAQRLQSMIVSCLHGLTAEEVRDRTLTVCAELLARQTTLNPSWTLVRSPSAASFPCFLCSILAGELKLSLEELLHCLQHEEALDSHVSQRLHRSLQAVSTCSELLHAILRLLVGEDDSEQAPWSGLDAESVGVIRKHIQSCFTEYADYLEELVSLLLARQASSTLVNGNNDVLVSLPVLDKMVAVVMDLADADEELRTLLLSKLNKLFSVFSMIGGADSADSYVCSMLVQFLSSIQSWVNASENQAALSDELIPTFHPVAKGIIKYISALRKKKEITAEKKDIAKYVNALEMLCQYVLFLLKLHRLSLQPLVAGDGLQALESLFHCKIDVVQELHNSLADVIGTKNSIELDDCVNVLVTQLRSFNMHAL